MINRGTCRETDCSRPVAYKGRVYGKTVYRAICEYHRRPSRSTVNRKNSDGYISNNRCERCGYEGKCHRHRLGNPNRKYTKDNVIVLCKDCHLIAHR